MYSYRHVNKGYDDYFKEDIVENVDSSLVISLAPDRSSPILSSVDTLRADMIIASILENYEVYDINGFSPNIASGQVLSNPSLTFNTGVLPKTQNSVTAGIFAGGVFGYIPNGLGITIDFDSIDSPITTPVTTIATDRSFQSRDSVYTEVVLYNYYLGRHNGDGVLSYAGGVIGRNPSGVTINRAAYTGAINNADNALWLGQITEVNAGTISNCKVMAYNEGSCLRTFMGGLVGYNTTGGKVDSNNSFKESITLKGKTVFGGFIGDNAAEMSLDGWNVDASTITIEIVGGEDSEESAIGLIIGVNNIGNNAVASPVVDIPLDITNSSIKTGTFLGAEYAGAYVGINQGIIYNSAVRNYIHDAINAGDTSYRTDILNDVLDSDKKMSIYAVLTVKDCTYSGIVAGCNRGVIEDICIPSACVISCNDNCNYVGAVCGEIDYRKSASLNVDDISLSHCINMMNINANDSGTPKNAAGIIGLLDLTDSDTLVINQCDNHGNIYGRDTASGILAKIITNTAQVNVAIDDCINTGTISTGSSEKSAGIVAENSGSYKITLCRNYGVSDYGIATDMDSVTATKCLVANSTDSIPSGSMNYYIKGNSQDVAGSNELPTDNVAWPLHLSIYKDSDNTKWLTYEDGTGGGNIATDMSWDGFDDPYDVSVTGIDRMHCFDVYFLSKWQ